MKTKTKHWHGQKRERTKMTTTTTMKIMSEKFNANKRSISIKTRNIIRNSKRMTETISKIRAIGIKMITFTFKNDRKRMKKLEKFMKYEMKDEDVFLACAAIALIFTVFLCVVVLKISVRVIRNVFADDGPKKNIDVVVDDDDDFDEKTEMLTKRDYARTVTMNNESTTRDNDNDNDNTVFDYKRTKQKERQLVNRANIIGDNSNADANLIEENNNKKEQEIVKKIAYLTDEEKTKIKELRALVDDEKEQILLATYELKRYCSDAQLARNLRARKWDVLKAFEMLKKTLLWRAEFKPERITYEDIKHELRTGKQYRSGRDRSGRRIVVMRPSRENTREHDGNIKLLVYTFENALWRTHGEQIARGSSDVSLLSQEQICMLINFSQWSLRLSPSWRTSMETLHIMQEHYPERLGLAVCYDPPSVFSVFWKLISPFIDAKTKSKIRFIHPRSDKAKAAKKMNETFNPNTIDSDMGGRVDSTWDIDEYSSFLRKYDAVKKNVFESSNERTK